MIQTQIHLNVADNSGARELMRIRAIGANNFLYAHIVIRAIIVHTHKEIKHDNGMIIRYDDNVAIVIDQEGNPKGTQNFVVITRELRQLNFTKIVSLALKVL
ncbi:hypothetical protein V6Z11_A03G081600 [Gossypium hirsutum]